jgi:hypothetical protein
VEASWNNIHWGGIPRCKWSSRPRRGGDTRGSPGIILSVFSSALSNMKYMKHGLVSTYPLAQISRVVSVRDQPLVHELTWASVLPFALPKVKPFTSGK